MRASFYINEALILHISIFLLLFKSCITAPPDPQLFCVSVSLFAKFHPFYYFFIIIEMAKSSVGNAISKSDPYPQAFTLTCIATSFTALCVVHQLECSGVLQTKNVCLIGVFSKCWKCDFQASRRSKIQKTPGPPPFDPAGGLTVPPDPQLLCCGFDEAASRPTRPWAPITFQPPILKRCRGP